MPPVSYLDSPLSSCLGQAPTGLYAFGIDFGEDFQQAKKEDNDQS